MLFHVTWTFSDRSEESTKRSLAAFGAWEPPAGAEFQGFYATADGSGGVAIIEADSVETVARVTAPWTPWLSFTVTPILPVEQGAAIAAEGIAFRDSVG